METKERQNAKRGDVIRCEFCGEDYSVTYKRCPFCDGKGGAYAAHKSGGKRIAGRPSRSRPIGGSGGGGRRKGVEPVQIIGFILSLILIAAAVYILLTVLGPLFRDGKTSPGQSGSASHAASSQPAGPSVSQPASSGSSSMIITPIVHATDLKLDVSDITLRYGESYTIKATVTPADSDDAIVWSSNSEAATISENGTVTNTNPGSTSVAVTITAKAGDVTAQCIVRCSAGGGTVNPGTPVGSGTRGVVTGTTTGLLIRSGPGREYAAQDSAMNGAEVTILEDTGTGWYKISYTGANGKTKTGYVSRDYIMVK